jgi:hypothetical protein
MCFKVLRDSCDDRIDGTLAVGRLSLVSSFAASPRSLVTPAFVSAMPLVSHSRRTTALVLLATALCGACDDGTITIKGDVPGLDTIGLRGDSLIARAGRPPMFMDSLKAVADGKLSRSPRDANGNAGTDAGPTGFPFPLPSSFPPLPSSFPTLPSSFPPVPSSLPPFTLPFPPP